MGGGGRCNGWSRRKMKKLGNQSGRDAGGGGGGGWLLCRFNCRAVEAIFSVRVCVCVYRLSNILEPDISCSLSFITVSSGAPGGRRRGSPGCSGQVGAPLQGQGHVVSHQAALLVFLIFSKYGEKWEAERVCRCRLIQKFGTKIYLQ